MSSWQSSTGPIVAADLMAGQAEDHRLRADGVAPGHRRSTTTSPAHRLARRHRFAASQELRARRVRRIDAATVRSSTSARTSTGGSDSATSGPRDTELTLVHGEALDADGDVTQDHLAGGDHTDGGTLPSARSIT